MRLAIVGNSHLAALKFAHDRIGTPPGSSVCFWGLPGGGFKESVAIDGTALPGLPLIGSDADGPEARTPFDAADYDAVVLYAQSVRLERTARALAGLEAATVSSAFRAAFLDALTVELFAFRYARALAGLPVRVVVHAAPFFAEGFPAPPLDLAPALALLTRTAEASGATFLIQPRETIGRGWRTRADYLGGNVHLDGRQREGDRRHMNADFGETVLRALYDRLL